LLEPLAARRSISLEQQCRVMWGAEMPPVSTGQRHQPEGLGVVPGMCRHVPMSDMFSKVEVISGIVRRRRFTTGQKLAIVAGSMQPGLSMSYVARQPVSFAVYHSVGSAKGRWPLGRAWCFAGGG
jgi:hypothetical protein